MLMNFLLSVQFPCVFALRRLQLSFFRFRALVHVVANVTPLQVVANLNIISVLVSVPFNDVVPFPHAPPLTPGAALAVVALFIS